MPDPCLFCVRSVATASEFVADSVDEELAADERGRTQMGTAAPWGVIDRRWAIGNERMTLPAKSRRTIVVDNVSYYWTRGRSPENGWVTIQHGSGRGPLLRIDLWGIPLPVDIANGIRFAIANGWSPTEGDQPMYLGFNDKQESDRFVLRSADSPDYWKEFVGRDIEVIKGKE